ncbi:MAG: F0F1 ATP synthase subunit A [Chloroflexi bacterium]|nr:F0F1 ATP synthase subunit A [Chloroflexota bacterium]
MEVSLAAETLFNIGPLRFTNSMLTTLIVIAIIVFVAWRIGRNMKLVPSRLQALGELLVETLMGIAQNTSGRELGRRVFPLTATIFLFIIVANWMALLPGFGSIGLKEVKDGHEVLVPFFRPANADLNTTAAMAIIAIVTVQVIGIRAHGVFGYMKEFATPVFLLPVHIISEISRIISLAARLFANTFGGEVLVMVMYFMAPVAVPVIFMGLEMFFGMIQALIFSVLALVYMTLAYSGHGGHKETAAEHQKEMQKALSSIEETKLKLAQE